MRNRVLRFSALLLATAVVALARPFMIVVYNVENLVDADGKALLEDYGPHRYTPAHVLTKVQNVATILAKFENGRGPDVILFQEIEDDLTPARRPIDYAAILRHYSNTTIEQMLGPKFDAAIADLPSEALLAKAMADRGMTGYNIVVAENPTPSGGRRTLAQVCVIFTRFPVLETRSHATVDARAILEVKIDVDGHPLYLFNNHWKSGASDPGTEKIRIENARTLRTRIDQLLKEDPNVDIVIGGDLNSQYNQRVRYRRTMDVTGINDVLGSQGNELAIRGPARDLYNLWHELPPAERASDTFRGQWGTLMNLIVSRGLYDYRGVQYIDNSFGVAKLAGLNVDDKGLPRRWSFAGPAGSGFSDHFPLYAKFTTVRDNRPSDYIPLRNASDESSETVSADAPPKIDYAAVDLVKAAALTDNLPEDVSIRTPDYLGKVFRVEGVVGKAKRLTVRFRGEIYDVWTYDAALREKLREQHKAGEPIRFYGELGQFKQRWQFVIRDPSWVK